MSDKITGGEKMLINVKRVKMLFKELDKKISKEALVMLDRRVFEIIQNTAKGETDIKITNIK